MPSNTIVPASQIAALQTGLDSILKPIAQALQAKVYAENLPIIGTLLGSAASQGQAALQQFGSLETKIFNALNAVNNTPQTVAQLQTIINNALVNTGFANNGVVVGSVNGQLTVTLDDTATDTFSSALSSNFGLPGLDFQTSGTAQAQLGYALNVTGTVDTSGVFSSSAPGGTALTVNLGVTAPNFAATGTLGSGDDTILGDLRFGAVNNGSSLQGSFSLDTNGGATFTGNANLNVELTSDMGTAALPSVSADLVGGWTFEASNVDPLNAASFGDTPTIALDNVTYQLGSFVNNVIDPVIDDVNAVLQSSPIQTLETLFNTPLDFLGGGTVGNGGLLGPLWQELDVAGSIDPTTGLDGRDGQITLVDFLQLAENFDPGLGIDVTPLVQFLSALKQVQQWVTALAGSSTAFGTTTYDLGSFTIPDDIRSAVQVISQAVPVQVTGSQPIDLPTLLQNLVNGSGGGSSNPATPTPTQAVQALLNSNIFSFPIITNPSEAVQFLLGGTADLFDANLPAASFNFGSINAAGVPTSTISLLDVPILVFPPLINLDLGLSAAFQGSVALDFGYDTSGLTAFEQSGFKTASDLLNGLFVQSPTLNGTAEPVVQLAGAVEVGATLSVPGASVSASGDIGGVLDLSFSQPGKNYISTLLTEFKNTPFSIFDASGRITAGFELVARAFLLSPWTFSPARILLAQFGGATASSSSGPTAPTSTTWVGGAVGDFETSANWNPTFVPIGGVDYYGDATIGAGSTVAFHGTLAADLTSLTLAANSVLNLTQGTLSVEDSTIDSPNSGTIVVGGSAQLFVQAGFKNTGIISITGGTLVASGLMDLNGGGSVLLPNAVGSFIQSSDPNALLWNEDNTISGGGTIGADLLNDGVVDANVSTPLMLAGNDTNKGLLEAIGNGGSAGSTRTGGLQIASSLDNTGGTIAAFNNGLVVLENGITVSGGTLLTGGATNGLIISNAGSVTLDGGTAGMAIAGVVLAGNASTLTLTGLITSGPFSTTLGNSQVDSANGIVLLQGATIHNGLLNALVPATGPAGAIAVIGTATLDGSAGDGSLAIDGQVQVAAGNTLVVDGWINPGGEGGGIGLAGGTLIIGNGITDAATFGTSLPGSAPGTGGRLAFSISGDSVVTGADAGSSLTNNWYIFGAGTLGNGQLAIINTANGTIAAGGGTLVLNGGVPVLNAGVIEAALGELDLKSNVANAGGTIQSLALDSISLDGATIGGGMLSGGGLIFGSVGAFLATGHAMLDGSASPVTLADDANVLVGSGDTLTLAGSIVNQGGVLAHSTIAVEGNASVGGVAVLQASGTVTLSGGGAVVLTETSGAGTSYTQEITGVTGDTLDNIDNQISGYGSIGVGDNTLTLINEAAGTINANGAGTTLVLNTGTHTVTNRGLLEATNGGTLDLLGSIANAGGTLLGAGGTALLDGATLTGGLISSSGTGSVRAIGSATLDGRTSGTTVSAGADVAVDAGNTLTALGTITNHGIMQATGGTLVVNTGTVAVINVGRLGGDLGGILDLRSNVTNAGGTIAVTNGEVLLDGVTVTNGLLAGQAPDTGFIDVVNTATLTGTGTVAAGSTVAPTTGLLNTANIRVQGSDTLTLKGTITNRGDIFVIGNSGLAQTAAVHVSGTVALTGGGMLAMQDGGGGDASAYELITGTVTTDTLDNINNTIFGYGEVGAGDSKLTLINETGGTLNASGGSLVVNTGSHAVVNKGLLDATTGILDLHGTVTNTGTVAADGGTTLLDGATISGGMLSTSAGGAVRAFGSATLNGITSAITLAPAAQVIVGGGSVLTLQGSIVNHGTLGVAGDTVDSIIATERVVGTVTLSGGGEVSLYSLNGTPPTYQVITGSVATDTLDNIDNTIFGYGELGGGKLKLRNETGGKVQATGGSLVVNTGANPAINNGLFSAVGGTLDLQGVVDSTGGGTLQAVDLGVGGAPGVILLDGGTLRGGTVSTSLTDTASMLSVSNNGGTLDGTAGALTLAAGAQAVVEAGTTLTLTGSISNHGTVGVAGDSYDNIVAALRIAGTATLSGGGNVSLYALAGGPVSLDQAIVGASATAKLDNIDNTISGYGTISAGQFQADQRGRRHHRGRRRRAGHQHRHQHGQQPRPAARARRRARGAGRGGQHLGRHRRHAEQRRGVRHRPARRRHLARRHLAHRPDRLRLADPGHRQRWHPGRHRRHVDGDGQFPGCRGAEQRAHRRGGDRQPRHDGGRRQRVLRLRRRNAAVRQRQPVRRRHLIAPGRVGCQCRDHQPSGHRDRRFEQARQFRQPDPRLRRTRRHATDLGQRSQRHHRGAQRHAAGGHRRHNHHQQGADGSCRRHADLAWRGGQHQRRHDHRIEPGRHRLRRRPAGRRDLARWHDHHRSE
jgi:hypothetical protein